MLTHQSNAQKFHCTYCPTVLTRKADLKQHMLKKHVNDDDFVTCLKCDQEFADPYVVRRVCAVVRTCSFTDTNSINTNRCITGRAIATNTSCHVSNSIVRCARTRRSLRTFSMITWTRNIEVTVDRRASSVVERVRVPFSRRTNVSMQRMRPDVCDAWRPSATCDQSASMRHLREDAGRRPVDTATALCVIVEECATFIVEFIVDETANATTRNDLSLFVVSEQVSSYARDRTASLRCSSYRSVRYGSDEECDDTRRRRDRRTARRRTRPARIDRHQLIGTVGHGTSSTPSPSSPAASRRRRTNGHHSVPQSTSARRSVAIDREDRTRSARCLSRSMLCARQTLVFQMGTMISRLPTISSATSPRAERRVH
jgi:hypothetical protein